MSAPKSTSRVGCNRQRVGELGRSLGDERSQFGNVNRRILGGIEGGIEHRLLRKRESCGEQRLFGDRVGRNDRGLQLGDAQQKDAAELAHAGALRAELRIFLELSQGIAQDFDEAAPIFINPPAPLDAWDRRIVC